MSRCGVGRTYRLIERYLRTLSGAKTATNRTIQPIVTRTGSVDARLSEVYGLGLPQSSRSPVACVLVGFHSAIGWRIGGRVLGGMMLGAPTGSFQDVVLEIAADPARPATLRLAVTAKEDHRVFHYFVLQPE